MSGPFIWLILLLCAFDSSYAQSVANYAVTRTTGITYNSIMSVGLPCNNWRYIGTFQQDDNRSYPVAIGFDFWYYGTRYTEVSISTNGYIDFSSSTNNGGPTSGPYGYSNVQFSNPSGTLNAVAPIYDDQTTQGATNPLGNSIRTYLTGSAPYRVLTIEWYNMAVYMNSTPSLNYQVKLYETTGAIDFVYGTMTQGTASFSYTCGINGTTMSGSPTPAELKVQQVANTSTFSNTQQNNLSALPANNTMLSFTPPVPLNPSGTLTFTGVQTSQMTLNWTDWATNERGYVVYASTDGINYDFRTQTAAGATSTTVSGLYSGTTYYWRVYAVTEGALSVTPLTGTQATLPGTTFISITSGNWATGSTWNTGTVPTINDNVIIANGHTVTINANANCHNLQVGQGGVCTLRVGNNNTPRTFTVQGNITVNSGAWFGANPLSDQTHTLIAAGNITNSGTVDMSSDANSKCNLTFTYDFADQTVSGSGALTRFNLITVDKGSSMDRMVDITSSSFAVPSGFLTMLNGTFRFSSATGIALTPFSTTASIPYRARIWLNSSASTMSFTGGNVNLYGELRVSSGTVNVGSAADNSISSSGGLLTISGGTVNVAGRYDRPSTAVISRFNMSGGTLIVNTIGSTSATSAPFMMDVAGSQFYHTGGTIIIRREGGTGAQNLGFNCTGGTISTVTNGGTLQIGDASTPVSQTMLINTVAPVGNLLLNSANATGQLVTNSLTVVGNVTLSSGTLLGSNLNISIGGNWTNTAGVYTGGANTTTFNGTLPQTISRTGVAETFNDIVFSGAGAKLLLQAISCSNLTINSGANFSAGTPGFQVSMTGNWLNNGFFSAGTAGIVLCNGTTAQTIGGSVVTDFRNLTIQNAAGVSIAANENLLGTLLLNSGMFTTTGFNFTLISNASGTARIGTITGGDITGNIIQQRYIYNGPANWRQVAAPVTGNTLQGWNDDIVTSGFPGSDYPSFPFISMASYDETVAGPKEYGYVFPTTITDPIDPLAGYYVYIGPLAVTLDVTGPPVKFNQSFSVTYTPSAGALEDGWNMLTNPYPSTIDWDAAGWTRTNTDQVLYVWNPALNQYATYVGGIGTNGGSQYIPSSQAFWIRATAASPVVSVTESVKSVQDPLYMRSAPLNVPYLLKLKLTTSNGEDETVIRFNGNGSDFFDVGYDAYKMSSMDTSAPYIASTLDSIEDFSINTMGPLTSDRIVPLKVYRTTSGTFTISRDSASDMPQSACIILEDLRTGTITPFPEGASYTYNHIGGDTMVRFLLHFSPALDKGSIASVCPSSADGKAWASGIGNGPWDYTWQDASGNVIAQNNAVIGADTVYGLIPGIYTVIIDGNTGYCPQREDTVEVHGQPFLVANSNIISPVCPNDMDGEIHLSGVTNRPGPYSYQWSIGGNDSSIYGVGVGPIDVYITDAAGCTDTLSYNVNSISQLDAAFVFPDDTVYMPNPINPWNYSLNSSSWFWDFGDMTGTATDANPFYFYAASGTYTVTMVAYDSLCSDTAWGTIVVMNDVGMPELISSDAIQLANTPQGADLLFSEMENEVVEVQIFAADGRLISASQEAISSGIIHLNMLGYANGNYFVRVINDGKVWGGKVYWGQ